MNAEREIVNWWLNRKGYFTLSGIKVAQNKEIDLIAIKTEKGIVKEALHVETACSISSADSISPQGYAEKFNDALIVKKISDTLEEHIGAHIQYGKTLVLGRTSKLADFKKLPDIAVHQYKQVLYDVLKDLDKQNYRNEIIRTLQLIKYLTIADPKRLALLLEKNGKIMGKGGREKLLKNLFEQKDTMRLLEKESFEETIIQILRNSTLNRPEKLAQVISEKILGSRSRKKFLYVLLKCGETEEPADEMKEVPLKNFFT
ncbi:MAG: hypothetical protein ABH879_05935 [archaeon]